MTTKDELQEALAKAYEILDQKAEEEAKAVQARAAYNQLSSEGNLDELTEQVEADIAAKEQEINQALEGDLATARKPLEAAQKKYDRAEVAAKSKRAAELEAFSVERKSQLAEAKLERETKLAAAEMEVHTAKQRVQNLENTFNNHCDTFKAQRGPDLKALIESLKE